jgi:hypothetical protein
LFRLFSRAAHRPSLDHTRDGPKRGTLAPMIKVDQVILAAVACVTALRLLGVG